MRTYWAFVLASVIMANYSYQFTNPSGHPGLTQGQSLANLNTNQARLGLYGPEAARAAGATGFVDVPNQGGGSNTGNFMNSWQSAYDAARAANEARYNEINQGYQDRYNRGNALISQLGGQQRADTNQRYDQIGASNQQDLTARGLAGTTVLLTMRQGNERERSDALNRVNQNLIAQRVGTDAALSGDKLQFMERRTDSYPDQNLYSQMMQNYGQSGGGGGGYGGGWAMPGMGGGMGGGYQMPMMMADAGWNDWGGENWNGGRNGRMGGLPKPTGSGAPDGGGVFGEPWSPPTADLGPWSSYFGTGSEPKPWGGMLGGGATTSGGYGSPSPWSSYLTGEEKPAEKPWGGMVPAGSYSASDWSSLFK